MQGREYTQNNMYRLDLQTFNWDSVGTRSEGEENSIPSQIDEHTVCLNDNNKAIIFGGFIDGERTNKIYQFDLDTHRWSLIKPAGGDSATAPTPRAGHSASLLNNALYVFGGKNDEN